MKSKTDRFLEFVESRKMRKIMFMTCMVVGFLTILLALYGLYNEIASGRAGVQSFAEKSLPKGDNYRLVDMIDKNRAVIYAGYNCTHVFRITLQGMKKCEGQYYVFAYREDGKWKVNESSKKIIW